MPSKHFSGSDTSRPEMGVMGIMNRARGMQIVENGFHVSMMFLLLGLFLSIVNLPVAYGDTEVVPSPLGNPQPPTAPPPVSRDLPPPPVGLSPSPPVGDFSPLVGLSPLSPLALAPPPPPDSPPPSPTLDPPPPAPPTTTIVKTGGDTWNDSEKAGVVIASIAALLQVAVVAFLLIKRHQMLTTVEYDDIDDLEYDTPRDSNFRDIESA